MKYIVVSATGFAIGPGERLRLTESQIVTRRHALIVIDEKTGEVEPTTQLVFKRGEVLNLSAKPDDLTSYLRSVLELVVKAPADPKVKTPATSKAKPGAQAGAAGSTQPDPTSAS